MGSGRWNAQALAHELEVSVRTIHRILQALEMANIPWYFCKEGECYRVRAGFRFPGMGVTSNPTERDWRAIIQQAPNIERWCC